MSSRADRPTRDRRSSLAHWSGSRDARLRRSPPRPMAPLCIIPPEHALAPSRVWHYTGSGCYNFFASTWDDPHRPPATRGHDALSRRSIAMLVGAFHFPIDYVIEIGELARALETRGFESLFVCEHTHIPVSRRSPYPSGGDLPKRYSHTHDPFVALSFAAAATRTLKLGTGIALMPQRDPIITAKSVASLDELSGGRFIFAIGGGWNVEEMENHGARYETRFQLLRERVLAMKALWTQEEAEFHGRFVNFDPVWLYPKPKQRPHPPIFLGGESDHTVRRVVEFCDGWFPRPRGGWEPKAAAARLRQAAIAAGRDPATLSITVFNAPADQAALAPYREAGIARVLLEVPDASRDEVLRRDRKSTRLNSSHLVISYAVFCL